MYRYLSLIVLAFTVSGCGGGSGCSHGNKECNGRHDQVAAASAAPIGDIRIVTAEPDPRVCQYIDDTMGYSSANNLANAQSESRRMMKQNAARMGGNIIRLDTNSIDDPGMIERGQVVLNGRVFKCDMSVNPTEVLGPINRTNSPGGGAGGSAAGGDVEGGPLGTGVASADGAAGGSKTNPPPQPKGSFNEQAFLNSGEEEYEG